MMNKKCRAAANEDRNAVLEGGRLYAEEESKQITWGDNEVWVFDNTLPPDQMVPGAQAVEEEEDNVKNGAEDRGDATEESRSKEVTWGDNEVWVFDNTLPPDQIRKPSLPAARLGAKENRILRPTIRGMLPQRRDVFNFKMDPGGERNGCGCMVNKFSFVPSRDGRRVTMKSRRVFSRTGRNFQFVFKMTGSSAGRNGWKMVRKEGAAVVDAVVEDAVVEDVVEELDCDSLDYSTSVADDEAEHIVESGVCYRKEGQEEGNLLGLFILCEEGKEEVEDFDGNLSDEEEGSDYYFDLDRKGEDSFEGEESPADPHPINAPEEEEEGPVEAEEDIATTGGDSGSKGESPSLGSFFVSTDPGRADDTPTSLRRSARLLKMVDTDQMNHFPCTYGSVYIRNAVRCKPLRRSARHLPVGGRKCSQP